MWHRARRWRRTRCFRSAAPGADTRYPQTILCRYVCSISERQFAYPYTALLYLSLQQEMLWRGAIKLARRMSTMSTTPVEDAMRVKAWPNHPLSLHSEADRLLDQRSSEPYYPRDLQRLPNACSPQSHARQRFQGDTFSLGYYL